MGQYAALIRVIACIAAAALLFVGGCRYGATSAHLEAMLADEKEHRAIAESMAAEQVRSAELNAQVQALLSRKPARETIREIVNANPSDCVRPDAVTSGLQNEVDAANAAIAASRGGDPLQAYSVSQWH